MLLKNTESVNYVVFPDQNEKKNVTLERKQFFKTRHAKKFLIRNLTRCILQTKIGRVIKFLNQNRTPCENFV